MPKKIFLFVIMFIPFFLCAQNSNVNRQIHVLAQKLITSFNALDTDTGAKRIAVIEFSNIGNTAEQKNIGQVVSEILTNKLAESQIFTIVERSQLEKVMNELALAQTGLIDKSSAQEVGFLLGAQAIISGSVTEAGEFFIVNARMIDVDTGNIQLAESIEIKQQELIAISNKMIVIKKYPITAAFRSMVLPGWGQFYNDSPTRGYMYIGATTAALAATFYFKFAGDADYDKYQDNTPASVKYFDSAQSNYDNRDIALYCTLGIWFINILDAYLDAQLNLNASQNISGQKNNIYFGVSPSYNGVNLSIHKSF